MYASTDDSPEDIKYIYDPFNSDLLQIDDLLIIVQSNKSQASFSAVRFEFCLCNT